LNVNLGIGISHRGWPSQYVRPLGLKWIVLWSIYYKHMRPSRAMKIGYRPIATNHALPQAMKMTVDVRCYKHGAPFQAMQWGCLGFFATNMTPSRAMKSAYGRLLQTSRPSG